MEDVIAPPSYTATDQRPADPPPIYTFPTSYVIGSHQTTGPLVNPNKLKGHLGLLRAFYKLRLQVEDGKDNRLPEFAQKMEAERRWVWFVGLAVERCVAFLLSEQ